MTFLVWELKLNLGPLDGQEAPFNPATKLSLCFLTPNLEWVLGVKLKSLHMHGKH